MTEEELQILLNSGDPADIDKALAFMDENKEDVTAASSSGKPSTQQSAKAEETDVETGSSTADVDAQKGVQSKNGEHVLPYAVLEQARHDAQEAKRQLQLAQQQVADANTKAEHAEALQRQIALLEQQMEKAGLKPVKMDEALTLTDEELEALDEYGDVGAVSKKAARKVVALEAQVQELLKLTKQLPAQPSAPVAASAAEESVYQAIAAVDGLDEVMRNPTLSTKAIAIDDKLQADPKWANKPMVERFGEVMRQLAPTLLKHDSAKQGKRAFDPDRVDPPLSINGIANSQADTSEGLENIFNGMSEAEIQAKYLSLSSAEQAKVNQLLGW